MNPFNFNAPMIVIFVLVGLGVGLSIKYLGYMANIGNISNPDSKGSDSSSSSSDEIPDSITPISADDSTNSPTNLLSGEDEMIDTLTIEPTSSLESSNIIKLVQRILVKSDNNVPLSCSLSSDGSRMAVSSTMDNGVYIYDYLGADYVKSLKIPADEDILFGSTISMSGNGNALAIGSRFRNNASSIVQLYSYSETLFTWEQLGNTLSSDPILLYDATHISLSLSYTGSYLVIGNNNSGANGVGSGQVSCYKYSNQTNNWITDNPPPVAAEEIYGTGESISLYDFNDTLVLAVASPLSGQNYTGSVSVYEYNEIYSSWTLLGEPLTGIQSNAYNGISLSLSTNPNTNSLMVAIGSKYYQQQDQNNEEFSIQDQFKVFEYSENKENKEYGRLRGTSSEWIQYGTNLYSGNDQIPNEENALSFNGYCIALSSPYHSTDNSNVGNVTIQCSDEGQKWIQLGDSLSGEENEFFGYQVSLSSIINGSSVLMVSNKYDKVFLYRVYYGDDNYKLEEIT